MSLRIAEKECAFFLTKEHKKDGSEEVTKTEHKVPVHFKTNDAKDKEKWAQIFASQKFSKWAEQYAHSSLNLHSVTIRSLDWFGNNLGFCKLDADVTRKDGTKVPGVVFLRGGAVAILVLLKSQENGREFAVLTTQARAPIGADAFLELPAGMMDEAGHFAGVAAKELEEETGIKINASELIDMTELAFNKKGAGVVPSCGGSDEAIQYFLYRKVVTGEELAAIESKVHGKAEENEQITLKLVPALSLWRQTTDSKAVVAHCLYKELRATGKIKGIAIPELKAKIEQKEKEKREAREAERKQKAEENKAKRDAERDEKRKARDAEREAKKAAGEEVKEERPKRERRERKPKAEGEKTEGETRQERPKRERAPPKELTEEEKKAKEEAKAARLAEKKERNKAKEAERRERLAKERAERDVKEEEQMKIALANNTFTKIDGLEPQAKGLSLRLKVASAVTIERERTTKDGKVLRNGSVILGDETGCVKARLLDEQIDACSKEGAIVVLRNATVSMVRSHMRLDVSRKWGKFDLATDKQASDSKEVNKANNISDIEFELVEVPVDDSGNAVSGDKGRRGRGRRGPRGPKPEGAAAEAPAAGGEEKRRRGRGRRGQKAE